MHRQLQVTLVLTTWVLLALSFVQGAHFKDQPLLHLPTVVALSGLTWLAWRRSIGSTSMVCILLFIWLHILGARYIYSLVPYDEWSRTCFGTTLSEHFGFSRNHYDRFVHIAFGVLAMVPQVELLQRACGLRRRPACIMSIGMVLAASALYEIFEWVLTLVASPAHADRYNGQQGDMWDAQKDMACALLGSVVMGAVMLVCFPKQVAQSSTRSQTPAN